MKTFIDRLIDEIKTFKEKDFSRMQMVFPTRRACAIFKNQFPKHFSTPQWLPDVCSIEDFILQHAEYPVADDIILLLELFMANKAINPSEEFEDFYMWGQILLKDFDEIDNNLVDVNKVFAILQDFAEVENQFGLDEEQLNWMKEFWQTFFGRDENQDDLRNRFLHNWKNIPALYAYFIKSLSEKKLSYHGLAYRKIAQDFQQNKLQLKYSTVVFAGFYTLSKSEEAIINHLKNNGTGYVYWDADSFYTDAKWHEAGTYIRNNKIDKEVKWKENYLATGQKHITFSAVVQQIGQAKYLGTVLENLLHKGELDIENTVIVLPDENLLLPVLNSLPDALKTINVTMGFPLKQTALFSFLNAFLNLIKEKKIQKETVLYSKVLLREVLNHAFIKHDIETIYPEFVSAFENTFAGYLKASSLNEMFPHALFELLCKNETDLFELVSEALEVLHKMNTGLLSTLEVEAFNYFNNSINSLHHLMAHYNHAMDQKQAIILLKNEIRNLRIPFSGEPVKGLQIMGFLETRLLDFDRVFMLSMNEGILPTQKTIKSYIPYAIRKAFGLQTHENNDAVSSYHFYRLMQRASNMHLMYNSYSGKSEGEPSRFLLQIELELLRLKNISLKKESIATPVITYNHKSINIKKDETLVKLLTEKFTGLPDVRKKLSPTALTSYIACPLRFYFAYIAQIPQPDEPDETIEGALLGTILHNSMEELYGNNIEVTEKLIETLRPKVEQLIDKNLLAEFPKAKHGLEGRNILTRKILIHLILRILESDKKLVPFKILKVEETIAYAIPLKDNLSATIYGKIDRMDMLPNAIRIVDYKTGRVKELKNNDDVAEAVFESPDYKEVFQLLMYALLTSKQYANQPLQAAFYQLRQMSGGMKFLNNGQTINIQTLQLFESKLRDLIVEILNPEVDFYQTSDVERCTYCAYKGICNR